MASASLLSHLGGEKCEARLLALPLGRRDLRSLCDIPGFHSAYCLPPHYCVSINSLFTHYVMEVSSSFTKKVLVTSETYSVLAQRQNMVRCKM